VTIDVDPPAGGWTEPWPRVFELAAALPRDRWVLVGGLMVQLHAIAARIESTRVTVDVDAALRIEAGVYNYQAAATALGRLGYAIDTSTRRAYRFRRGGDVVDLMVADHTRPPPRHSRRDVLPVEGGRQAIDRRALFALRGQDVELFAPDLHGAVVLKAAAHRVDQRDRDRHLVDAVTLLACIADTDAIVSTLKGSDRQRLQHLLRALDEKPLILAQVPADTATFARQTIDELRDALR